MDMLNLKTKQFISGSALAVLYILLYFGLEIKENTNIGYHINYLDIHWHHWLIALLFLVILELYNKTPVYYIRGFFIVIIIHGLLYKDRFDFTVKKRI